MAGIYYWRAPLTPLLSFAVVICVCISTHYLCSLSLALFYIPVCYSVPFVIHTCTHTHTHTRLTQQFISIPNLWERMSSGVLTPCMAACINICTLIWPRLSCSIHPDIDCFSQQVSVSPIWLMWGGCGREGGGYWTRVSHMPAVCYTTEEKALGGGTEAKVPPDRDAWHEQRPHQLLNRSVSHRIDVWARKHLNDSWSNISSNLAKATGSQFASWPAGFGNLFLEKSKGSARDFVMFSSSQMRVFVLCRVFKCYLHVFVCW